MSALLAPAFLAAVVGGSSASAFFKYRANASLNPARFCSSLYALDMDLTFTPASNRADLSVRRSVLIIPLGLADHQLTYIVGIRGASNSLSVWSPSQPHAERRSHKNSRSPGLDPTRTSGPQSAF